MQYDWCPIERRNLDTGTGTYRRKTVQSDAEKLVIYKPWREARDRSFTANFDFRLLASPTVEQYISVTKSTISMWSFVTASLAS